jgi:hypothetical protein
MPHGHKDAGTPTAGPEAAEGEKPQRRRRPRNRKRTRGGQTVTGQQGGSSSSDTKPNPEG